MKKQMILVVCTLICLILIATNFVMASVIPNTPSKPELLNYTTLGKTNTSYNYTLRSTSPDNNSIKYVFNWGDNTTTTTEFLPNGTATTQNHTWTSAGVYDMWVETFDNVSNSGKTYLAILINAIYVKDIGYLIDENGNGTYDVFHSNKTNNETTVQKQTNGTYLIDSNGDGKWDYTYDPNTDTLTAYVAGEEPSGETKANNAVLWYALTIGTILGVILLFVIYLITRKKQ